MLNRDQTDLTKLDRMPGRSKSASSILVVCEGAKTEPTYLSALVKSRRASTVEVVTAYGSAPVSVVADAAEKKKQRARDAKQSVALVPYDEVFCVFDVDEHPNLPTALETARKNSIKVILSNPCFEYWLLLHFERVGDTSLTRKKACQLLKKKLGGYKKGEDYSGALLGRIADAIKNSEEHHHSQWHIDPSNPKKILECCPSTAVHILVKAILGNGPT